MDFDKNNITEILNTFVSEINEYSSYNEILNKHIELNKIKILYIKHHINKYVDDNHLTKFYDNNETVPPYLNYLLSVYTKSFPQITKHLNKYIPLIQKIDNITIHPMIFQIVFINLIHSIYIYELCSDPSNVLTKSNIEKISNIQFEVELGISIFFEIFEKTDSIFKQNEDFFGYNAISSLSYIDYNQRFNNILYKNHLTTNNKLQNKLTELNFLLTHIEHLTEHNINETFSNADYENKCLNLSSEYITNKFDNELKLLDNMTEQYLDSYMSNYSYVKKFNIFSNINIDPTEFIKKNVLYFWTNYCSTLNGHIFDLIFKSFSNK